MTRTRAETAYLKAVGAAIRAIREDQGFSQEAFGFECGLDRTYISGVERGVRNPTVTSLFKIAKALGTKPGEFFGVADKRGR